MNENRIIRFLMNSFVWQVSLPGKTPYGGWVGAVAATIYIVDKAAFNAYMNTVREHPDWVLLPSVHSFTH
jgi:hypothetical protein